MRHKQVTYLRTAGAVTVQVGLLLLVPILFMAGLVALVTALTWLGAPRTLCLFGVLVYGIAYGFLIDRLRI